MEINEIKKIKARNKNRKIKKWLKKHAPIICISFAAFIVLLSVLLVLFQAEEELVKYKIKNEKLYTYSGQIRLDFYTEITLDHDNNVTKLISGKDEIELLTEPIYYEGKKQVIFPNVMAVIFPMNNDCQKKLNRYTIINGDASHPIANNVNLSYALVDSFIYDGYDVYFFTEDGKITYGDKVVEVSAMSFIRVEYNQGVNGSLYLYNYEKNEMYFDEDVNDTVVAEFEEYSVNLSYDKIIVGEDSRILNKNINSLPKLGK